MRSPETSGYARLAEAEEEIKAQAEQEAAREAAITEAYNDEAMRDEANAMNEQYDKNATRFATEVAGLNEQAHVEIFGTDGRTEGYLDPKTGEPLQKPAKGILETMRENPVYGKTQAERDEAADTYESDVNSMLEEGLELSQAKVVMDLRAQRKETIQTQEREQGALARKAAREQEESNRQKMAEYERKLSILKDQYLANGESEKDAEDLAMARLTPPDKTPVKREGKSESDKTVDFINELRDDLRATEVFKRRVRTEGIYTLDESKNPRKPSTAEGVIVPPVPPKVSDEVLATLPPVPLAPAGAHKDPWSGWSSSQEGFNTPPSTRKPTPPTPEDPSTAKTTEMPKTDSGETPFEGVSKGMEIELYKGDKGDVYAPKNLRQRLSARFKSAKQAIADKYHSAAATIANLGVNTKEYFADDEKGKRRKIIGSVAGVIAVGAAGYGAYKFGIVGGGEHHTDTSTSGVGSGETTHTPTHTGEIGGADQVPDHSGTPEGTTGSSGGEDALLDKERFSSEASRTITLGQEGDSIWNQSASFLEANGIDPSEENIARIKNALLEHYNISEVEATQLAVGREFTIPQEVLEDILRDSR